MELPTDIRHLLVPGQPSRAASSSQAPIPRARLFPPGGESSNSSSSSLSWTGPDPKLARNI